MSLEEMSLFKVDKSHSSKFLLDLLPKAIRCNFDNIVNSISAELLRRDREKDEEIARLRGGKFSDRDYHALKSRAEQTETERDFLDLCFKQKQKDLANAEDAYSELEQKYIQAEARLKEAVDKIEKLKVCQSCGKVLPRDCNACVRLWEN